MSDNRSSSNGGIGVAGLLGVAFVVLKLTGVIDWDWIWVLAPFWIGIALALVVLIIFVIGLGVVATVERADRNRAIAARKRRLGLK